MDKKLYMVFVDDIGEKMNIIVDDPKDNLSEDVVKNAMTEIINLNAFENKGYDLKAINSAYTIEKVRNDIVKEQE